MCVSEVVPTSTPSRLPAYGWPADLTDEQILERLFKLNQERAAAQ